MTQSIREKAIEAMARSVARKIADDACLAMPVAQMHEDEHWPEFRDDAEVAFDAAIKVLMEPDEAMVRAGEIECNDCLDQAWPTGEHANCDFDLDAPKAIFRAMLKAASQ